MPPPEPELDQLIRLIGHCLGRIDEHAFRIQDDDPTVEDELPDRLDDESATLQELVESLLAVDMDRVGVTVVNEIVQQVLTACLDELEVPIVIRQTLTDAPSVVAAPRALVTVSLQRALVLALSPLGPGDELRMSTRVENDTVVLEIESCGSQPSEALTDRAETLRDFVAGFGGCCEARTDHSEHLLVALEFPQAGVTDRSDRD